MTDDRRPLPRRFRRRLTLTFIGVAGTAAGALAIISFLVVRDQRLDSFEARARREAEVNLRLATAASPAFLQELMATYADQEGFDVVAVDRGRVLASSPEFRLAAVPDALREAPERNSDEPSVRVGTSSVGNERYVVSGGRLPSSRAELYFFFSAQELLDSLAAFRTALLTGWVVVALAAAFVGELVARRTLRPVAAAADAAHALAEGLLDTRLPVETRDEFGAWAAYFNEMADALADKITALSEARDHERRFTADVAHELRTPLGVLLTTSSVLATDIDTVPPGLRRPVELVVEGIRRLCRLVEDLLELSQIDAGQEALHLEAIELDEAVRAAIRAGGWEREVVVDAAPTAVVADRHRLDRIITNLVSNAVVHGRYGVAVRVFQEGSTAVVEVSDRGPGIPAQDINHLFDRFYKAGSGRSSPGSGLGLAIAAESARLLGGTLEATGRDGAGATFTFRLAAPPGDVGPRDAVSEL